jgi:hypothetical protein
MIFREAFWTAAVPRRFFDATAKGHPKKCRPVATHPYEAGICIMMN